MSNVCIYLFTTGINRKLEALSKVKGCEKLSKWVEAIKHHIYYTAATSTSKEERLAKWSSVMNHIQDIHVHDNPHYPQCQHVIRKTTDSTKWIKGGIYLTLQCTV